MNATEIKLCTTSRLPGHRVIEALGLARGNTIRARHLGRDIVALLRSLVGGEIEEYTQAMAQAREEALDRLREDAAALGANAVVGLRITTSTVMAGAAEVMAYGTAVRVEPEA